MMQTGTLPDLRFSVGDSLLADNRYTYDGNIQINYYDAEGLRHEMEENGKLVQFIFRGTEVVAEETQEEKIRYIRAGELLASDAKSAKTYYHYASDEMGSITHVTDEEGNILNRYEYDAWGNLTAEEEQVPNRFKYTEEQFDPITQQYYLRARFYNPALARFMQEDTYRGDGLNLYAYCANNPVRYVDPSGHWCDAKQNVYERLVRENGLDINNIDPDTKMRLMAEAANIVKGLNAGQDNRNREPLKPVADVPNAGRRGARGNGVPSSEERTLLTGEDWNDYLREQYGYENVNWDTAFSSTNDIADMPSSVTRMNPDGLNWYLNQNGIKTTPLGQGHLAGVPYESGGGFNAHYDSDYGATYVQYHPGSGHHGKGAYYKVSSGNSFSYSGKITGTQRFNLDGTVMK